MTWSQFRKKQALRRERNKVEVVEGKFRCRVRTDKANFGLSRIALIFPVEDNYPIPRRNIAFIWTNSIFSLYYKKIFSFTQNWPVCRRKWCDFKETLGLCQICLTKPNKLIILQTHVLTLINSLKV